jgi:hypothetical protein
MCAIIGWVVVASIIHGVKRIVLKVNFVRCALLVTALWYGTAKKVMAGRIIISVQNAEQEQKCGGMLLKFRITINWRTGVR